MANRSVKTGEGAEPSPLACVNTSTGAPRKRGRGGGCGLVKDGNIIGRAIAGVPRAGAFPAGLYSVYATQDKNRAFSKVVHLPSPFRARNLNS